MVSKVNESNEDGHLVDVVAVLEDFVYLEVFFSLLVQVHRVGVQESLDLLQTFGFTLQINVFECCLLRLEVIGLQTTKLVVEFCLVSSQVVIAVEPVTFTNLIFLESPADLAGKRLELDLHGHALRDRVGLVHCRVDILLVALALADHSWLERLEWPETTLSFPLADQECFVKEGYLATTKHEAFPLHKLLCNRGFRTEKVTTFLAIRSKMWSKSTR